ncbi:MAG: flagellar basal body rod protein FlgC [Myxococcota bacterium]|nr:flagellar basal body rod protein FlgC [Myxococcales bacterium]
MKINDIVDVAASGIAAQRARLSTTASNLANASSTRTAEGGPYRRRDPVFESESVGGPFADRLGRHVQAVRVARIVEDDRAPIQRFDPSHPDANEDGYVSLPNVSPVEELANMMSAMRTYEANLLMMRKVREMADAAMQLGR